MPLPIRPSISLNRDNQTDAPSDLSMDPSKVDIPASLEVPAPVAPVAQPTSLEVPAHIPDKNTGGYDDDWDDEGLGINISLLPERKYEDEEDDDVYLAADSAKPEENIRYMGVGSLTADQVLNTPYARFKHLEQKIHDVTAHVQQALSDQGKTDAVAAARKERGNKYKEMATEIDRLVLRKLSHDTPIDSSDTQIFVAMVVNEILGFGPIEPLWQNKHISEIMINGPKDVRVEIKGKPVRVKGVQFRDSDHLLGVCRQMLSLIGRRIDPQNPKEDGSLPDGSRLNVVHPDIAPHGPLVTIRRFPDTVFSVEKLVQMGSLTEEMAVEIGNFIYHGFSAIVAGGTGTGKTSMLNALSGCIPETDRVITIEDTMELRLNESKHVVSMVSRPDSAAGTGGISIRALVRNALRMRPDRIVVGEVRDGAAYDMLQAMNTGHDGSLTTVHANDAEGTVERIALLVSEVGEISPDRALSQIAGGVDIFIIIGRYEDGSRRVAGIYEVPSKLEMTDGKLSLNPIPLWEFVHDTTDEEGNVHGHYQKINSLSEAIIRKHRLNVKKRLSLEEIYAISAVEEATAQVS